VGAADHRLPVGLDRHRGGPVTRRERAAEETEVGDGEIAIIDEFEVTEEERDRDWDLASQIMAGFFSGVLAAYGMGPGVLGAMFQPVVAKIMASFRRIGQRRIKHSAETLLDAADAAALPIDEFFAKAVADDRRHELLARALVIAQDTAVRDKRRALGRALAAGVMGDDARIDEELLFIRAIDDIDEMHIRVLGCLADGGRLTTRNIALADPGLGAGASALLSQLQSHGLIDSRSPVTPGGAMTPEPYYFITDLGRGFLGRLREEAG
jgi:hypothetical protein